MYGLLASLLLVAVPPSDHAAIEGVISEQIEDFQRDDGAAAFAFASPDLQTTFGTPERFMGMVRSGYQPVYRPRSFTFGDLVEADGRIVQEVAVIGPDGVPRMALYTMEQQPDGSWRIAGCQLVVRAAPSS